MERAGLEQAKLNHKVSARGPHTRIQKGHRGQTFLLSMPQLLLKSRKNSKRSNMLDLHSVFSFMGKKLKLIIPAVVVLAVGLASVLFFQSASVFLP